MKKQILFFAALFCAATSIKAQMLPMGGGMQPMGMPTSQPWTTNLMTVPSGIEANLGTADENSLNFFTNKNKRVEIDKLGKVKVLGLSDSASIPDLRFLFIDRDGFLTTSANRPVPTQTLNCGEGLTPWLLGGNNPSSSGVGFDGRPIADPFTLGTCSDNMFALKSSNKNFVFINPNGSVGMGEDNTNTTAALDISSPVTSGQRHHLKLYGDEDGTIEATQNMHLYYDSNSSFVISRGSLNDVDANMIEMYPQLGISLNDNTTVAGNETVFGKANIGWFQGQGAPNNAKLNVNVNGGNAIDVFNQPANEISYRVRVNGEVEQSGALLVGKQQGAPNSAWLNVNVDSLYVPDAIDVFDKATNKVNFRVKSTGKVWCRELRVCESSINFPDFVFGKNYKLMSLKEREKYLKENKHLPYMISAKEVEMEGGVPVGKVMTGILQNTEELTLYLIDLNEKVEILREENKQLKIKLTQLEKGK